MTASPPPRAGGFYDPRTYDWEIGSSHTKAERRGFYARQAGRPGTRVLELGCGTGDISLVLAQRHARVVGLDSSRDMIMAARDKERRHASRPVSWVCARMEAFAFRVGFSAVIVPYHALFHVLEPVQLDRLLVRINEHLDPGGTLLCDVFTRTPETPLRSVRTGSTRTPDGIYHVHEDESFDPHTGRRHTRFTYQLEHPETGRVIDAWTRRLDYLVTPPSRLAGHLREAGFTSVTCFAAFDPGSPVRPGGDAVLSASRPEEPPCA